MNQHFSKNIHWMLLFFATDLIFIFVSWLLNTRMFIKVSLFILLFTAIAVGIGYYIDHQMTKKQILAMRKFLEENDEANLNYWSSLMGNQWQKTLEELYKQLDALRSKANEKQINLDFYRDYIEAWTHEMKTPLSLGALTLANHEDEISPYVSSRMHYVLHLITEDVDRILYYARLQSEHVDYHFTETPLDEIVLDAVSEYRAYAEEKHVAINVNLQSLEVVTDKKTLYFMICQLLSNAIKYADQKQGKINISIMRKHTQAVLVIQDNGSGVLPEDAPFIFDKGFTGGHSKRQKATGMGLYLVKKFATMLCIDVLLDSKSLRGEGFLIQLIFPLDNP